MDHQALLKRAEDELSRAGSAPEHVAAASKQLAAWLDGSFAPYHPQLAWQIESGHGAELLDAFYRVIPFGTGGRRGRVGIGPNRFNQYTLALSVQGHVDYLRSLDPSAARSVVIAFDVRQFHDFRKVYNAALPNPLLGLRSRDFARIAAGVYADNGVRVHMLTGETGYMSTPELSFAIRLLGASAGLNVSASHNHPDDNGGKIYNERGAQVVPPDDETMADFVERAHLREIPDWQATLGSGLVSALGDDVHEAYLRMVLEQSLCPSARSARVVFTPLNGTATGTVGAALSRAGFALDLVESQNEPDGTFANVPFRAPNPEVPESMNAGVARAAETGADLVIACDPDADRIGVCARTRQGELRFLSGNEIAVLVAHHKLTQLTQLKRLPSVPLVVKTFVTTELLAPLAAHFGATLIGDLLVGFKYHADLLRQLEERGSYAGVRATAADFVLGVEESHGVLVTPAVRDKDAAGAALHLCELCSLERARGRSLVDYLDDIYRRFGYYASAPTSMVMTGASGLATIQAIQRKLRERTPKIGDYAVEPLADYLDEQKHGKFVSTTDRVCRDIVAFRVGDARVIVRPSGTEPKTKIYVELRTRPLGEGASDAALAAQKQDADQAARAVADETVLCMLGLVGLTLPRYALRVSPLLSFEDREDFAKRFTVELEERCAQGAPARELSAWIDQRLARYGKDARGLVADAMRQHLAETEASSKARAPLVAKMRAAFFES